ncbi:unnamed protein product, partial [Ectocarpus fasciculatus]
DRFSKLDCSATKRVPEQHQKWWFRKNLVEGLFPHCIPRLWVVEQHKVGIRGAVISQPLQVHRRRRQKTPRWPTRRTDKDDDKHGIIQQTINTQQPRVQQPVATAAPAKNYPLRCLARTKNYNNSPRTYAVPNGRMPTVTNTCHKLQKYSHNRVSRR